MKRSRESFDVAVIGGGSAGLAAAITAARQGARTVLIERHGFAGGMGTASLVHTFCGLYLLRDEPGAVLANSGFPSEMAARMTAATGIGPVRMGRVDVLPQHPVEFVRIADELIAAEPLLDLKLHTEVISVRRDDDWVVGITGRGESRTITVRNLVDASGDAVVASMLGADTEKTESPRLQRPAYVFGLHQMAQLGDAERLETAGLLMDGIRKGNVPPEAVGLTFRKSGRIGEVFGTLDLSGGENYDPLDAECLTRLELEGRAIAGKAIDWLTAQSAIWKGAYISHWPISAGIRESRRWIGEEILTGADLLAGNRFENEIALATWPMEFRENNRGPKLRFPEGNKPAGIPLGCLKPKGMERLFIAGRCISCDHDAQASIRVMGTCFATGQAAGKAAAT